MKREELRLVVQGPNWSGKWTGQVLRDGRGYSNPYAESEAKAWDWVFETARREVPDGDDGGVAA